MVLTLTLVCSALLPQQSPPPATKAAEPALPRLAAPFRVEADGAPIVAVIGHAAPFVVDYDGDGVRDLIVGMFGNDGKGSGGTARFYKNLGTNAEPKFGAFSTLMSDGKPATMESS
ncbi:MAG TPA: hypothetical protein VFZ65_06045 [Planctomycetota bacterium]|nr:hypothetical protein [Planctomycetota bacterium]